MPRGRIVTWRRVALLLFIALAVTGYFVDAHLKRWPGNGYAPIDANYILAVNDFPGFWQGLLDTSAGHDINKTLSRQIGEVEREFRLATGVRPTPIRWSLWLGQPVVVSADDSCVYACLRPGLLFHIVFYLMQWLRPDALPDPQLFAWRNGYLILGNAPLPLERFTPSVWVDSEDATPGIYFKWRNTSLAAPLPVIEGTIGAREGVPIAIEFTRTPAPTAQPFNWPGLKSPEALDDAILDCRMENTDAYQGLAIVPFLAGLHLEKYSNLLPKQAGQLLLDTGIEPMSHHYAARIALFDLDCSAGEMIPHAGVSLVRHEGAWEQHPLNVDKTHPPSMRVPFAWDDVTGFLLPILGKDYTVGCAVQGNWAHTANPAENTRRLLIDESSISQPGPAFRASLRWDLLADAITAWLRQRQQLKLLPGDPRAFDNEYGCWTDALKALGKAELASIDDERHGVFTIRGSLAVRAEHLP